MLDGHLGLTQFDTFNHSWILFATNAILLRVVTEFIHHWVYT